MPCSSLPDRSAGRLPKAGRFIGVHRPAGARAGRLDRRGLGACHAVQGGLRRQGVAGRGDADRRRDAAGDRIFPGARAEIGRTALHRPKSCRRPTRCCMRCTGRRTSSCRQVSHEVRTPMTSIRSFSEILLTDPNLSEAQRERFVSTIHHESLRLTKLLDEILDLSALEQGERGWENVPHRRRAGARPRDRGLRSAGAPAQHAGRGGFARGGGRRAGGGGPSLPGAHQHHRQCDQIQQFTLFRSCRSVHGRRGAST